MRIGLVDLDTSHPAAWVQLERELGHEVVGVWDGGAVHPPGYAARFAEEHRIPRVYDTLIEMAREVDCAVLHGCDWDRHVERASPFVEAGKAVLVDKPLAGRLADLEQLRAWAREGARITGGSSLRFAVETREWLAKPAEERGEPHTALCGCAVDPFNYGIHAYSMLAGIMGAGVRSVRHLGQAGGSEQRRVQVNWRDGRMGILVVGKADGWVPFHAAVVTNKGAFQYGADAGKLYRALLEAVLPYLAGYVEQPPVPMDALLEPELCALAARRSWLEGDREVTLDELDASDAYDGAAFAEQYRRARYPA
ncbi:MAG TPA: Gfo/Idh/MocA family oxidoreductase [Armatimonadota bacterium]|nr:Gfo/Idh/MocA family oxidoreductase [Armatimonadota bacterium]